MNGMNRKPRSQVKVALGLLGALVLGLVSLGIIGAALSPSVPDSSAARVTPSPYGYPPDSPATKATTWVGEGTWSVGDEVKPGTYTTTAPADCYWARLSDFQGGLHSIIANGNLSPGAHGRITVAKADAGVEFRGDCVWHRK